MDKVVRQGQLIFALAIMAFGIQNIVCGWFRVFAKTLFAGENVTAVIPWVPAYSWLAYLTGLVLFALGVALARNVRPRLAATLLGILFLAFAVLLETRRMIHTGSRTVFFEALALGGSALMLADTFPSESSSREWGNRVLEWVVKSGRFLFAISAIAFGIDHLIYLRFVASLVPWWIPWHLFWTLFTGLGFIAAGLSIGSAGFSIPTNLAGRWGAASLGLMFLLWFVLLHLPRSLGLSVASGPGAPRNPNEWSSAFIALGMWGGSWICAYSLLGAREKRAAES